MEDEHRTQNEETASLGPPPERETIRLTAGEVALIHSRRRQYLVSYGVVFLLQVYVQFGLKGEAPPDLWLRIVGFTCLGIFYVQFVRVLRTMGYPWSMWIPIGLLVFLPIPGVIVLAFMDRTMAKALRAGVQS